MADDRSRWMMPLPPARELHEKDITPSDMAKIVGGLPLHARRSRSRTDHQADYENQTARRVACPHPEFNDGL
jgi:hypothetical protein